MKKLLICIFLLSGSNSLFAQVDCDLFPGHPLCEEGDPDAPLDSGVGLLIGAAAFYAVKKLRRKQAVNEVGSSVTGNQIPG